MYTTETIKYVLFLLVLNILFLQPGLAVSMCSGICTSSCFSGTSLLFSIVGASLAERDVAGWVRTAWRAAGRSGATSAECSTYTAEECVKGMGPALVLPLPG